MMIMMMMILMMMMMMIMKCTCKSLAYNDMMMRIGNSCLVWFHSLSICLSSFLVSCAVSEKKNNNVKWWATSPAYGIIRHWSMPTMPTLPGILRKPAASSTRMILSNSVTSPTYGIPSRSEAACLWGTSTRSSSPESLWKLYFKGMPTLYVRLSQQRKRSIFTSLLLKTFIIHQVRQT